MATMNTAPLSCHVTDACRAAPTAGLLHRKSESIPRPRHQQHSKISVDRPRSSKADAQPHRRCRSKTLKVLDYFFIREPSTTAWEEFAENERKKAFRKPVLRSPAPPLSSYPVSLPHPVDSSTKALDTSLSNEPSIRQFYSEQVSPLTPTADNRADSPQDLDSPPLLSLDQSTGRRTSPPALRLPLLEADVSQPSFSASFAELRFSDFGIGPPTTSTTSPIGPPAISLNSHERTDNPFASFHFGPPPPDPDALIRPVTSSGRQYGPSSFKNANLFSSIITEEIEEYEDRQSKALFAPRPTSSGADPKPSPVRNFSYVRRYCTRGNSTSKLSSEFSSKGVSHRPTDAMQREEAAPAPAPSSLTSPGITKRRFRAASESSNRKPSPFTFSSLARGPPSVSKPLTLEVQAGQRYEIMPWEAFDPPESSGANPRSLELG